MAGDKFKNGAIVIEADLQMKRPDEIIVLGMSPGAAQPFFTGRYQSLELGWMHGRYFGNVNEALYDYMERI